MDQIQNQNTQGKTANSLLPETSDASRRRFLKLAAATGVTLPFAASMAIAKGPGFKTTRIKSPRPQLKPPFWEIEAARVTQSFTDGSTIPFHRYIATGSTAVSGTVPVLTGTAGDIVQLRVRNTLPYPVRPKIVGSTPGPFIAPGSTSAFDIVVPPEGTWLLTDDTLGDAAGPMGLGAVIVSRSNSALRKANTYDREFVLLYVDSDDRWNAAIDAGQVPNYALYEPNFHTVNNLTYPNTASDPGTTINCQLGERVLLRMCNLGWMRHSIHFHGYHVDIERINNQPQSIYGPKDTVPLPGHTTMEVLLTIDQPGVFPFHPHSLTATTDNGLYAGGQISLIVAT